MGSPWYLEAPVKALDHVRVLHNGCVRKLMMVYFSSSSIAAASKTWKWGWSLKLRLFPLPPLAKPEVERSLPSWTMRHVALNHERPYRSYSRRPALASARTSAVYWRPSPPPSTSRRTLSRLTSLASERSRRPSPSWKSRTVGARGRFWKITAASAKNMVARLKMSSPCGAADDW